MPTSRTLPPCNDTLVFWQAVADLDKTLFAMQEKYDFVKQLGVQIIQEQVGQAPKRLQEKLMAMSTDALAQHALKLFQRRDCRTWELGLTLERWGEIMVEQCETGKAERKWMIGKVLQTEACRTDGKAAQATDDQKTTETCKSDQNPGCTCREDAQGKKSRHMSHQCGIMEEEPITITLHPDGTPCQCWQYV